MSAAPRGHLYEARSALAAAKAYINRDQAYLGGAGS